VIATVTKVRAVVDRVVERLWPGRTSRVEPLPGGITNANFLVDLGDEQVVVRVPGRGRDLLGIDPAVELAASTLAASTGIAPEILAYDEETGCLVSRFLVAKPIALDVMAEPPMLELVVGALQRVHGAGRVGATFDYFAIIDRYHEHAAGRGVPEPFDFEAARAVMHHIAEVRPFRPTVFGHNDLLNANFLFDGSVRILDWEYAGMTDPFFDLANLSANHGFGPETDAALLTLYFGADSEQLAALLALFKLVSELREAMWGVVQLAVSDLEVDFAAYAAERGGHFAELLSAMDLPAVLAAARGTPSA
jgi:aminoglycoside phosphotransferase (APT) family kinase protein